MPETTASEYGQRCATSRGRSNRPTAVCGRLDEFASICWGRLPGRASTACLLPGVVRGCCDPDEAKRRQTNMSAVENVTLCFCLRFWVIRIETQRYTAAGSEVVLVTQRKHSN